MSIQFKFRAPGPFPGFGWFRQYVPLYSYQGPNLRVTLQRLALWPFGLGALVPALLLVPNREVREAACLMAVLCLGFLGISIRHLSHSRLGRISNQFVRGPLRKILDVQFRLEELERTLAVAGDLGQCWDIIEASRRDFGFAAGRLRARGLMFETASLPLASRDWWQLRIPLEGAQYLNLYRDPEAEDHPAVVGKLAGILRIAIQARLGSRTATPIPDSPMAQDEELLLTA